MIKYIVKRLGIAVVMILGVTMIIFLHYTNAAWKSIFAYGSGRYKC